ncbi:hypothetical protein SCP_1000130 [Sparassis crispa]|uniref:Uncharacterized protein n=1 Tax=Sparassis crispa TaxID=139825 RepID=A0A401GX23_9APHY|nr:hypothetical protein SCP_1000130 [Sparassis crispa]GBE86771.1 hypothetical protein SCP_1000130 [Sparassis crispa]
MASAFDILGLIFGVLGFLSSIPVFYAIVSSQLPSQKLKELDEVLVETEHIWRNTVREGLFAGKPFEEKTNLVLSMQRCQAENLRLQAHRATSFFQEFKAMLRGLSWSISYLCLKVKDTRADISSTTAEERKRIELEAKLEQLRRQNAAAVQMQSTTPMASNAGTPPDKKHHEHHKSRGVHDADELSPPSSAIVCDASESDSDSRQWQGQVINGLHDDDASHPISTTRSDTASSDGTTSDNATVCYNSCASQSQDTSSPAAHIVARGASNIPMQLLCDSIARVAVKPTRAPLHGTLPDTDMSVYSIGPAIALLPLSSAALSQQSCQVKQEAVVRRPHFYKPAVVRNATRMMPRRKRFSGRFSDASVTRRKSTSSPVLSGDIGSNDVEECWEDCSDGKDTICIDVPDVSYMV